MDGLVLTRLCMQLVNVSKCPLKSLLKQKGHKNKINLATFVWSPTEQHWLVDTAAYVTRRGRQVCRTLDEALFTS